MAMGGLDRFDEKKCASILRKINPKLVTDRVYLSYVSPPYVSEGSFSQAEVEEWLSRMNEIQEDLIWLLELPYERFWSYFAFDPNVTALLSSYMQNTPRPYELDDFMEAMEKVGSNKICEAQEKIHALVLAIYMRITDFEDATVPLSSSEFGELIYEKFVFDIPTICDICLVYGGSNHVEVAKIVSTVFSNQKLYLSDFDEAVKFAVKTLDDIVRRTKESFTVDDCTSVKLTPLEDLIDYLLDTVSSLSSFLEFYSPASAVLLKYKFESLIADMYTNTVPLLYNHVGELCFILFSGNVDTFQSKKLKQKLRMVREEMIKIVHHVVTFLVNESLKCKSSDDEEGVKNHVASFLDVWHDCLAFDVFVRDYNQLYSIHNEILLIKEVNSLEVANEKISFLMEAVNSYIFPEKRATINTSRGKGESLSDYNAITTEEPLAVSAETVNKSKPVSEEELQCLISAVSDILSDIDVKVIRNYLLSMDCSVEKTVDAILKDSVAGIPLTDKKAPDPADSYLNQRLNVFDGDEFDVMVHDEIDMSKVNLGKKKDRYKDVKDLIDDKSFRQEMAEMYQRFSVVSGPEIVNGEVDTYDDEYDDTYDESDTYTTRTFVVPRVLREVTVDSPENSESDDLEEQTEGEGEKAVDQFVANPAEIREKMEQKRLATKSSKDSFKPRNVIGNPKGQGQDHSTQLNRQRKSVNKASHSNHNRKARSSRKHQQGMF